MKSVRLSPWLSIPSSAHTNATSAVKQADLIARTFIANTLFLPTNIGRRCNAELVKIETFRSKTNVWYANALILIKWEDLHENDDKTI